MAVQRTADIGFGARGLCAQAARQSEGGECVNAIERIERFDRRGCAGGRSRRTRCWGRGRLARARGALGLRGGRIAAGRRSAGRAAIHTRMEGGKAEQERAGLAGVYAAAFEEFEFLKLGVVQWGGGQAGASGCGEGFLLGGVVLHDGREGGRGCGESGEGHEAETDGEGGIQGGEGFAAARRDDVKAEGVDGCAKLGGDLLDGEGRGAEGIDQSGHLSLVRAEGRWWLARGGRDGGKSRHRPDCMDNGRRVK